MKVKELKRLLGYFSDDIDVQINNNQTHEYFYIEDVKGLQDAQGKFSVRLELKTEDIWKMIK